jgi:hypothetical protein
MDWGKQIEALECNVIIVRVRKIQSTSLAAHKVEAN